ncbi:fibronectin type III-like domain-contianing protein [Streptomyces coeruleorubidus]|uniref:fibronectin type III-like domain-contianing protein n=1 Tax=Streptomyces coeruleorubidus TaxID=116188 RepID=UPI0033EFD128
MRWVRIVALGHDSGRILADRFRPAERRSVEASERRATAAARPAASRRFGSPSCFGGLPHPARTLAGFAKVTLRPGERRTVPVVPPNRVLLGRIREPLGDFRRPGPRVHRPLGHTATREGPGHLSSISR